MDIIAELAEESGLELPQATELCKRLAQSGIDISVNVLDVDEAVEQIINAYKKIKN